MDILSNLTPWDLVYRLGAAMIIGAVLGLNRNLHDKPAGLRTHALVALGSALVVVVAIGLEPQGALKSGEATAISRVIQGVLQGIGFLGAGVILHSESGKRVHGLTTAASIWIAAGLGVACGLGIWRAVLITSVLVAIVLLSGGPIERGLHRFLGPPKQTDEHS